MKLGGKIKAALPAADEPLLKRIVIWAVLTALAVGVGVLFVFTLAVAILSISLPDVRDFDKLAGVESTLILDREGGILYTIHGEENRKYVPISDIHPLLQKATIAIEDDEFFTHSGFDIPGITAGLLYEVFGLGRPRGGSTITQQLAKNAFLSRERSYIRKMKELILAIRLERAYEKDKILELYLNRIPYGNNAYGAELATQMYFGKSASQLTLAEAAILASLPKAPTFYSPFGPNLYSKIEREVIPTSATDLSSDDYTIGLIGRKISFSPTESLYIPGRSDLVLSRMEELGFITEEEEAQAQKEIQHVEFKRFRETIRAAHFVFEVRRDLEKRFGKEIVAQGGLKVYTTIDPKLQQTAEEAVAAQIKTSKVAHGAGTGALFSMDAKTGEVLSMVGSADYFDVEAGGSNNHVFARRQPGSSFKPIVYAKAFLNRYAPATVIYDTPTNFGSNYEPQNYDGTFRGPMTIRRALGQSRNIPAIKAYFMAGQQQEIIDLANKMGIKSLSSNGDFGPSLALGAGEVTLAEMVQAFSVFANNGVKRPYYFLLKVVDRDGDIMYERGAEENAPQDVLDPQVAYLINNVLSDKSVYLGPRLDVAGHTTAVKTGTSNKEITPVKILPSNLWTIGYTPSVVTGVWVGNSNGDAMKNTADGYNVAAPIWSKYMTEALKDKENEAFEKPEGVTSVVVSRASGKLPSKFTPKTEQSSEIFASFSVPTEVDDIFAEAQVNTLDNKLPNEYTPAEYVKKKVFMNHHDAISDWPLWQEGIKKWLASKQKTDGDFPGFPPTEGTAMFAADTAQNQPSIQIVSPAAFSVITDYDKHSVDVGVNAPNGVDRVEFYLDTRTAPNAIKREAPYSGSIRFPRNADPGVHIITAKVFDRVGYIGTAKVEVRFEP